MHPMGIGPMYLPWKGNILPLNYECKKVPVRLELTLKDSKSSVIYGSNNHLHYETIGKFPCLD